MESGGAAHSTLARLVPIPVQAFICLHRGGRAVGVVQSALSRRGSPQGTPHRIQRREHSMGLFDVSSLLENSIFMLARRCDIVYHSS